MRSPALCGKDIEWIKYFKYLGNWVAHDFSEDIEINKKVGSFYASYNHLSSSFKHVGVKYVFKLCNAYCCYYGSQAWRLSDNKNIQKYI